MQIAHKIKQAINTKNIIWNYYRKSLKWEENFNLIKRPSKKLRSKSIGEQQGRKTEMTECSRMKRWPKSEGKKEHSVVERHIRGSGKILEQFVEGIIRDQHGFTKNKSNQIIQCLSLSSSSPSSSSPLTFSKYCSKWIRPMQLINHFRNSARHSTLNLY